MKQISTDKAPAAIGPYCQAMIHGDMVFTSGQIALDPVSGNVVGDDIVTQTKQVMANLDAVLKAAGTSPENAIKTTCFLADMADFGEFNAVYAETFTGKPARSCIAVKTLPKNVLVEVECIAVIK